MKEQSSNSTPKTKPALLDQYKEYKEHQAIETKKQKKAAEKNPP